MDQPIISRETIRARGWEARAAGKGRDEHGFNWHAVDAIAEWQAGYDGAGSITARVCEQLRKQQLEAV